MAFIHGVFADTDHEIFDGLVEDLQLMNLMVQRVGSFIVMALEMLEDFRSYVADDSNTLGVRSPSVGFEFLVDLHQFRHEVVLNRGHQEVGIRKFLTSDWLAVV